jgi:hypothetical protein
MSVSWQKARGEEVYGERSALERGHVRFLSEAPGEEVYVEMPLGFNKLSKNGIVETHRKYFRFL